MFKKRHKRLRILVIAILTIVMFQVTSKYAFGQSNSESAATSTDKQTQENFPKNGDFLTQENDGKQENDVNTPSDLEIKKVTVRALDKVEALQEENKAKDELINEQDKALDEAVESKDHYKKSSEFYKKSYEYQSEATITAEKGWKLEEERSRKLEKDLRKSRNRTKIAAIVGAAAGAIAAILILK